MKYLLVMLAMVSACAVAKTTLKPADPKPYENALYQKALTLNIEKPFVFQDQTFALVDEDKNIGIIIPGKGKIIHNSACFIGWSVNSEDIQSFIPTIGFDEWEIPACKNVSAIGIVSSGADMDVKIGIIYNVLGRDIEGLEYVILNIDKGSKNITIDKMSTQKVVYSDAKNIQDLRRALKK
ncbi:hypothetical protein [Erwinia oleae]|uniref:hypothetical protein n=1 Tax=Erwinia oleae TaxID=796334 RepID=UPI00068CD279|nr:hypothetical protein [Erwinia oleae]